MADERGHVVELWMSHPHDGNDDCIVGSDPISREEAEACFAELTTGAAGLTLTQKLGRSGRGWTHVRLVGPNWERIGVNPAPRQRVRGHDDDDEWRRERAMEAGMGLGISAFNEAMGWD